jgi:hypothetical protein
MEKNESLKKDSFADTINTEEVKNKAANVADDAKRKAREQAETHKHTVADQTENIAGVVERVADEFRNRDQQSLADYTGQLADSVKGFADNLRGRSIDELLQDTNRLARNNPTAFLLGSVAIGFALSRFVKASTESSAGSRQISAPQQPVASYERHEYNRPTAGSQLDDPTATVESPTFGDVNR